MIEKQIWKNFLIMAICYLIDSIISFFLPYNLSKTGISFIPSLGLMMFILLVMTLRDTTERFFFAAVCGLYYCILYSNSLLIYVLVYVAIAFARSYIFRNDHITLLEFMGTAFVVILLKEIVVYYLMVGTNVTSLSFLSFVSLRLLPTTLINTALSPIVYYVFTLFDFKTDESEFVQVSQTFFLLKIVKAYMKSLIF